MKGIRWMVAVLVLLALTVVPATGGLTQGTAQAHPLGNFSISHYSALRVEPDGIAITYVIDMAEIPTFQEIQANSLVADATHPSVASYLGPAVESLGAKLHLELNGARLSLQAHSSSVVFPPGAGDLPTLRMEALYRARLDGVERRQVNELRYRDENYVGRVGWKEIVAVAGPRASLVASSVPERDRSRALTDYPSDLLDSPPQDVEARLLFALQSLAPEVAAPMPPPLHPRAPARRDREPLPVAASRASALTVAQPDHPSRVAGAGVSTTPAPTRQDTPRSAFTQLITTGDLSLGVIVLAMITALGVGAAHALEPGHGKAMVAAYLVGSRGTAWHAAFLGVVVTAAHTAGVFLLGLITIYGSRYIVPERFYPWLGAASGLTIAGLGAWLFLQRYARQDGPGQHATHSHDDHDHDHDDRHPHHHGSHHHGSHHHGAPASLRELFMLGITGGIVPCPAALVVLLSAIALRRTGFGLLLIVAFSVGLAAVLVGIGLLTVWARRFMAHVNGDGPLVRRWLPLASAAVMTVLGVAIAIQALMAAGIVQVRL